MSFVRPLVILLTVCTGVAVHAQDRSNEIERLRSQCASCSNDSMKVALLDRLSEACLIAGRFDAAKTAAQEGLTLAERIGWADGRAQSLVLLANAHYQQDDYTTAENLFTRTVEMGRNLGLKKPLARALADRGRLYTDRASYPSALEDLFAAAELARTIADTADLATALNTIGYVYAHTGDLGKARDHCNEALALRTLQGDKRGIAFSLHDLGELGLREGRTDEALVLCARALDIREMLADSFTIGNSLVLLARIHLAQDSAELALREARRAAVLAGRISDRYTVSEALTQHARALLALHREREALPLIEASIAAAGALGAAELERQAVTTAYAIHRSLGDHAMALRNLERSYALGDSINSIGNTQRTARLEMERARRETELGTRLELEKRDAHERKQRYLRNGMFGALAFTLLLAGSIFMGLKRTNRERKRAEALLHNMLPATTVAELKHHGHALAKRHDRATVLFADVVSFTRIAGTLPPEQLVLLLHEQFSAFDAIMERNGVERIKTIGDAYMAAGGLGDDPEGDCLRVTRAALEMQAHVKGLPPLPDGTRFQLRIGMHTGPVVSGVVGTKKFAYDIWGDTVNIASRMEASGEAGRVNISNATYLLLHGRFHCQRRGRVEARNVGPVIMFFVESELAPGEAPVMDEEERST